MIAAILTLIIGLSGLVWMSATSFGSGDIFTGGICAVGALIVGALLLNEWADHVVNKGDEL